MSAPWRKAYPAPDASPDAWLECPAPFRSVAWGAPIGPHEAEFKALKATGAKLPKLPQGCSASQVSTTVTVGMRETAAKRAVELHKSGTSEYASAYAAPEGIEAD